MENFILLVVLEISATMISLVFIGFAIYTADLIGAFYIAISVILAFSVGWLAGIRREKIRQIRAK